MIGARARCRASATPRCLGATLIKQWVRADLGLTLTGALVDTWADQSGNGNNWTAAGAARPTWTANVRNGKPALVFDGVANTMTTGAVGTFAPTTGYTHFGAWSIANITTNDASRYLDDVILTDTTTGNFQHCAFRSAGPNVDAVQWDSGAGSGPQHLVAKSVTAGAGTWHISVVKMTGAGGTLGFSLDGGAEGTQALGAAISAPGATNRLGANYNATVFSDDSIGEIIVGNVAGALSASQEAWLLEYTRVFWGK